MSASSPSDVRGIVSDLQKEIRRHRLPLGDPGRMYPLGPLDNLRRYQRVNPHLPIGWPVMPKGLLPKLAAYAKKIVRRLLRWYINPLVDQQNDYNASATEVITTLQAQAQEHAQMLGAQLEQARRERATFRLRLQRLEAWQRDSEPAGEPPSRPARAEPSAQTTSPDYFLLGAEYRNEELVRERLHDYDDLFAALLEAHKRGGEPARPVLDIGCGRGELVDYLNTIGLPVYGIDTDRDAVKVGQAAGRDLRQADALTHLSSLPDDSLAAVTLIQVVEHMAVDDLLRLLRLAIQRLAPGGLILAETINPVCVWALVNFYLLDPSHRAPLHPQLARFLMEQVGFEQVEIRFLHPVPEEGRLEMLKAKEKAASRQWLIEPLNRNTEQLNRFLYGSQDYAAMAYKPKE